MLTDSDVFTVILLMNVALGIPAPVGPLIVPPTCAKAPLLAHKTKRRERRQPRKPLRRIGNDRDFSLLWADEDVSASGSIFNQWDETASLLCWMANQRRYGWLAWHRERRASQRSKSL